MKILLFLLVLGTSAFAVDFFSEPVPTATVAPSPTPKICAGDCNGDGQVRIQEVVLTINLSLGKQDILCCPNADINKDGKVVINEVIRAISNASKGCK